MTETTVDRGGPTGLEAWLILVGIGVMFSPLRLAVFVIQSYPPLFRDGAWEVLTTPGREAYHPLWGPLIVLELVVNSVLILAGLILVRLFFRRSRRFPRLYVPVAVASLAFLVVDTWLVTIVMPDEPVDPSTVRQLVGSFAAVAIWVPYMFVSRRVANTFVR